jgi:hypothetical protein
MLDTLVAAVEGCLVGVFLAGFAAAGLLATTGFECF